MVEREPNIVYPTAVLIEELQSEEVSRRLNSVKHLESIGQALGPERARAELLPYLEILLSDEEEVLLELSRALPLLFDSVGGRGQGHHLLVLLGKLCEVEDASVRGSAIESYKSVLERLEKGHCEHFVVQNLHSLVKNEWFAVKVAAAHLIPVAIEGTSESAQNDLLELYKEMSHNSHTHVRKAVGENLTKFLGKVSARFENKLLDMLGAIAVDSSDIVKLLAVDNVLTFSQALPSKLTTNLLPLLRILIDDSAWRVRYLIANSMPELSTLFGREHKSGLFKPAFVKFLQDTEAEVKTAACSKLAEFCSVLQPEEVEAAILPIIPALAKEVDYVKATLCSNLPKICAHVGRQATNEKVMPVILELLRDESVEIKLCLFENMHSLSEVIGAESLAQSMMPGLKDLAEDKNWRARKQICELLPVLGSQLGENFFEEHLTEICVKLLEDQFYSVRMGLISAIKELVKVFGKDWVEARIFDEILALRSSEHYLRRLTAVIAAKEVASLLSEHYVNFRLPEFFTRLASDNVPNVRLNVAKAIVAVFPAVINQRTADELKAALTALRKDEDLDVKFFADQALQALN